MIGVHSSGNDPGFEIVKRIWPNENSLLSNRHNILKALKNELGNEKRNFNIKITSDSRSIFRYDMQSLSTELESSIGTFTLFAAWNAAVYVSQIENYRLEKAIKNEDYLDVTLEVLKKYGGL